MSRTQTIFFISALVFVGTSINAGKKAFEGRAVYHSQCSINPNPVQYQGHTGTVSVRRWWYVDTERPFSEYGRFGAQKVPRYPS